MSATSPAAGQPRAGKRLSAFGLVGRWCCERISALVVGLSVWAGNLVCPTGRLFSGSGFRPVAGGQRQGSRAACVRASLGCALGLRRGRRCAPPAAEPCARGRPCRASVTASAARGRPASGCGAESARGDLTPGYASGEVVRGWAGAAGRSRKPRRPGRRTSGAGPLVTWSAACASSRSGWSCSSRPRHSAVPAAIAG